MFSGNFSRVSAITFAAVLISLPLSVAPVRSANAQSPEVPVTAVASPKAKPYAAAPAKSISGKKKSAALRKASAANAAVSKSATPKAGAKKISARGKRSNSARVIRASRRSPRKTTVSVRSASLSAESLAATSQAIAAKPASQSTVDAVAENDAAPVVLHTGRPIESSSTSTNVPANSVSATGGISAAAQRPSTSPQRFVAIDSANVLRVVDRPAGSPEAVIDQPAIAAVESNGAMLADARAIANEQAGELNGGLASNGMLAALTPGSVATVKSVASVRETARALTSTRPLITGGMISKPGGGFELDSVDDLKQDASGALYRELPNKSRAYLTLDAVLQNEAQALLRKHQVPWGAVVAIEPKTGKVLALAGYSAQEQGGTEFSTRGGMPAASLFKMITAAAAVEEAKLDPQTIIRFRGGDYTLGPRNYQPDAKRDTRQMTMELALAKSCNPVFARIASKYLSPEILNRYATHFGFNQRLPFDIALPASSFSTPQTSYDFSRTAAGFMGTEISPVHAAMMASAIGNEGVMMRPRVIERVVDPSQVVLYRSRPEVYQRSLTANTSRVLLSMLEVTTISGTARKHFAKARNGALKGISVAAKTGTLRGDSPKGVFHWLVAVAPSDDPEIAIATVVVDPGNARINGTGLGRMILERYFASRNP